jgi:dihydrofolate reductase
MRPLKIMQHLSLDGVIQLPGDGDAFAPGDWTAPYRSPAGLEVVLAAMGARFDLLLGRRTYDIWAGHWPKAPVGPLSDRINAATKYVATHRPESLAWGPTETVAGDVVEGVRRLKALDGPGLVLWGSSTLTSALLEHELADEVVLIVYPVLLGAGKRLFADGTPPRTFALAGTQALPTGVVVTTYRPAGPLPASAG